MIREYAYRTCRIDTCRATSLIVGESGFRKAQTVTAMWLSSLPCSLLLSFQTSLCALAISLLPVTPTELCFLLQTVHTCTLA